MAGLIVEFVLLAVVIIVAGTFLTRFADSLGEATGLGRTLAGMLLLAIATSLPELAVDVSAALIPAPDLIVGDLLGSSLFNLLILAGLDLLYRTKGAMLSKRAAAHSLSAVTVILLTTVVLLFLVLESLQETSWELGRVGIGPIVVAVVYLLCSRLIFFDQQFALQEAKADPTFTPEPPEHAMSLRQAAIGYGVCTVVIFVAAPFLAHTADEFAEATGLGRTFVGTIFVALCTSLPEITTTRAAVRMGAFDLAVGNIFGSNAFNMLILLPADLFYAGNLLADVGTAHAITAAFVILVTAVATLGLLYRVERRFWIIEPDAALVILLVAASFWLVYRLGVE